MTNADPPVCPKCGEEKYNCVSCPSSRSGWEIKCDHCDEVVIRKSVYEMRKHIEREEILLRIRNLIVDKEIYVAHANNCKRDLSRSQWLAQAESVDTQIEELFSDLQNV